MLLIFISSIQRQTGVVLDIFRRSWKWKLTAISPSYSDQFKNILQIPDPRDPRPTAPIITTPPTSIITSQPVPSTMVSRPPSSTNTSYTDFNSENRGSSADDPSMILPIAIAAGVVACLLLVAVAIVIIRKRRRYVEFLMCYTKQ